MRLRELYLDFFLPAISLLFGASSRGPDVASFSFSLLIGCAR